MTIERGVPLEHTLRGGFVIVYQSLVDDLDGNYPAAIVCQHLIWRTNDGTRTWKGSHADIQEWTRLSEWKVRKALDLLRKHGWITSQRASSWDPTPVWTVLPRPAAPPAPGGENLGHEPAGTTGTLPEDSSVTSLEDPADSVPDGLSPVPEVGALIPAPKGLDAAQEFEQWWRAYPRRENKAKAEVAFAKARKDVPLRVLLDGAAALAASGRDPKYFPHASTWLNGRRWEDEPLQEAPHTDRQALILREEYRRAQEADARREGMNR